MSWGHDGKLIEDMEEKYFICLNPQFKIERYSFNGFQLVWGLSY